MNRIVKKTIMTAGIILTLVLCGMAVIAVLLTKEMKKFSTIKTAQVIPSVYAIDSKISNMFLLPNDDGSYISIDAGSDRKSIEKSLLKLNIAPKKIMAALFTHSDNDHVGGLSALPNAERIISEEEQQMVIGKTPRALGFVKNKISGEYRTVKTHREFTLGSHRVYGILTPGHTPGSTCWIIDDTLLFSGDAFGVENGKAGLFSNMFNMQTEQQIASIKNLIPYSTVKHVFTAHQGKFNYTDSLFR